MLVFFAEAPFPARDQGLLGLLETRPLPLPYTSHPVRAVSFVPLGLSGSPTPALRIHAATTVLPQSPEVGGLLRPQSTRDALRSHT